MTKHSRREFLAHTCRGLAGAAAAGAAAPWLTACARRTQRPSPLASGIEVDVGSLTTENSSMISPQAGPDGAPILIVRTATPDGFLALSLQCTHEGCPVNAPVNGTLTCPCHGSQFDLTGKVLRGPAEFPLGRYHTSYEARSGRLAVKFGG